MEGEVPLGVYAILDGARDEVIYQKLVNSDIENMCLFRGEKAIELATVAPYLISLEREDSLTQWLLNNGWGKSWGIFAQSSAPMKDLHRHFRRFLMVYDPEGKPLYFRYYDPRVLRVYLPTCNADELRTVFGPVSAYVVEGDTPGTVLRFTYAGDTLAKEEVSLPPTQPA